MAINGYLLSVPREMATRATGSIKRSYVRIRFVDTKQDEYYCLAAKVCSPLQFKNWAKREFGYLRYELEFGS